MRAGEGTRLRETEAENAKLRNCCRSAVINMHLKLNRDIVRPCGGNDGR
jgi:hypothetical protein